MIKRGVVSNEESNQTNDNPSDGLNITSSPNAHRISQQDEQKYSETDKSDATHEFNLGKERADF